MSNNIKFTDILDYISANAQAEQIAKDKNFIVPFMPQLIKALENDEIRRIIRPMPIRTITVEAHGKRNNADVYEVHHGVGSLATSDGLISVCSNVKNYGFLPISDVEWKELGNRRTVPRISLRELRKGNVPKEASENGYIVFARMNKDRPVINQSGQLSYDNFMSDDRVLMICGSPEARESLAKTLKKERIGSIGSHHRINEVGFSDNLGRRVFLYDNEGGFEGEGYSRWYFPVVAREVLVHEKTDISKKQVILNSKLEDTTQILFSTTKDMVPEKLHNKYKNTITDFLEQHYHNK